MADDDQPPKDVSELFASFPMVRELLSLLRALRNLKIVTPTGEVALQYSEGSDNAVIDLRSLTPSAVPVSTGLPDQSGNAGKVLTTDGLTASWT